jgi:hypothetical protein
MNIIERLEATRAETLEYYSLGESDLERVSAPGKWPVRFILHHLADTETVMYERVRRTISEPHPVVWVIDQDAWAAKLDYVHMPLSISQRIYDATRDAVIHYARIHYDVNGHLPFVHSKTGLRTLKDELDKIANHNANHLQQIRTALGRSLAAAGSGT